MALSSLRLRRALALSASFVRHRPFSVAAPPSSPPLPSLTRLSKLRAPSSPIRPGILGLRLPCATQRLSFHSSPPSSDRRSGDADDRKFDPDEILFEGCDYNHWLITMDFPKDPKPTPEEMVETYVQTLAKVVGSVEEAKKRMYACSTTTYNGFQAVMTEEMSEKFRGLPGVVFILPDSYIDPINKEYGGDKYDNGVITPRPPPIQYGRQGRYNDRNRNYNRPRYDRQGPPQGEGRNFAPQQSYGQDGQGYGPPGGGRDYGQTSGRDNFPGRRDGFQGDRRDQAPAYQTGFNTEQGRSFPSQEHRDFSQGQYGNFPPREPRNFPQGQQGYGGPEHGQGMNSNYGGPYQQGGSFYGQNYPGASGQNYGQNYSGPTQGQPLPHTDRQAGIQSEQSNFSSPQTRTNQE